MLAPEVPEQKDGHYRLWVKPAQRHWRLHIHLAPPPTQHPNTKTSLVAVLLSRPQIQGRALSSVMRLLCKHLNLTVAQLIVAFGYSKFPGAENPKTIATGFKFGTQGIIYLFIWLWILEYFYTDEQ